MIRRMIYLFILSASNQPIVFRPIVIQNVASPAVDFLAEMEQHPDLC